MSHPLNRFFRASFMEPGGAKERKYGMRFWATRLVRYEETLKLPEGWEVEHAPQRKSLDSESASLTFEAEPGDGILTYRFEIALKKGVLPAKDYPDYKKTVDAMDELSGEWIVCAVTPAEPEGTRLATEPAPEESAGSR